YQRLHKNTSSIMYFISALLVLAAPPVMVVKPGETFTIACKITGYSASGGGNTNWIRHSSGKSMEWIGWYYTSSSNGVKDSLKNKISFSSESSSNTDTAVYYCARDTLCYNLPQDLYKNPEPLNTFFNKTKLYIADPFHLMT
uniref:Ig-like domain-containing protein n=1 Tax=Sinocyclocheilus anshuiensis TaxID=1608454 RepID=A0A671RWS1_9TELE